MSARPSSGDSEVPIRVLPPDEEPWKPNFSSVGLRNTMRRRNQLKKHRNRGNKDHPRPKKTKMGRAKTRLSQPPPADVTVYTDGACVGNPGPGGHAAVIIKDGGQQKITGGFRRTTNQRMELLAAITALEALTEKTTVNIISDSKYLVDSMTRGWVKRWKAKGWWQPNGRTRPNVDLWNRLLKAEGFHKVAYLWVKGHAGNEGNEAADRLAEEVARQSALPVDRGYEKSPS